MVWKKVKQDSRVGRCEPGQAGQALLEFILGLMIVISFFFFFMRMSASFVVGNYIHYATFMTARAYMASAKTKDIQSDNANQVMSKMLLGRWKALIKPDGGSGAIPGGYIGPGPYAQESPSLDTWNYGATFSFNTNLSIYPWSKQNQGIDLKLTSESWMPREQSEDECNQVKQKVATAVGQGGIQNANVEWDNGC